MHIGRIMVLIIGCTIVLGIAYGAPCVHLREGNVTIVPSGTTYLCPNTTYESMGVIIGHNQTTLDCQGSTITGPVTVGVFVDEADEVAIQNCRIEKLPGGIVMKLPGRIIIDNVTLVDNIFGVAVFVHSKRPNTSIYWNAKWFRNTHSYVKSYVDVRPIYPPEFEGVIELRKPAVVSGGEIEEELTLPEPDPVPDMSRVVQQPKRQISKNNFVAVGAVALVALIFGVLVYRHRKRSRIWYPQ